MEARRLKVAARLDSSWVLRWRISSVFLSKFLVVATILGIPCLVDASLSSLLPSPYGEPSYVSKFPSYKDSSHWIKAHPNTLWPFLAGLHLRRPCFQIGSHSQVLGIRTLIYLLGDTIQPTTAPRCKLETGAPSGGCCSWLSEQIAPLCELHKRTLPLGGDSSTPGHKAWHLEARLDFNPQ